MNSYQIIISGDIQRVYYRKFVSQALMRIGVQGYVQNLTNGTVEIVARIYDDEYENVLKILHEGSPLSSVKNIISSVIDDDDIVFDGFEIRT